MRRRGRRGRSHLALSLLSALLPTIFLMVSLPGAAAANYTVMLNAPMPLLGASPRPPATTDLYAPAPTPNSNARPPAVRLHEKGEAYWGGKLRQSDPSLTQGDGYAGGSNFSTDLERRHSGFTDGIAPSVNVHMPLD